uniref:Uncharacterized protein n=1 Tax=Rhizophora mucronata TaxID=61149 RepID=A0A2P2IYQ2_RHIMU
MQHVQLHVGWNKIFSFCTVHTLECTGLCFWVCLLEE